MKTKKTLSYGLGAGLQGVAAQGGGELLLMEALSGLTDLLGPKNHEGVLGESIVNSTGNNLIMALGGKVGMNVPVEVENKEIAQTPDGQLIQFSGASHEKGGIDTILPQGTDVFSDRIAINGKTMQERKKIRENKIRTLDKYLGNRTDKISRDGYNRSKAHIDMQNEADIMVQQVANDNSDNKLAGGTGIGGLLGLDVHGKLNKVNDLYPLYPQVDPDLTSGTTVLPTVDIYGKGTPKKVIGLPQQSVSGFPSTIPIGNHDLNVLPNAAMSGLGDPFTHLPTVDPNATVGNTPSTGSPKNTGLSLTDGDLTGIAGNLFGGLAPLAATVINRAGDKPNVNAFKNFGEDALASNKKAMSYVGGVRDSNLQDITLQEAGSRASNRNSARSVNVQRSLDFASDAIGNQATNKVYDSFANQMMGLFGQQSQLENTQDNAVMSSEYRRDEADRADRDAFFTNLTQNLTNLSTVTQKTGKDLNTLKQNKDFLDILPDLSKYMLGYEQVDGKWTMKKQSN